MSISIFRPIIFSFLFFHFWTKIFKLQFFIQIPTVSLKPHDSLEPVLIDLVDYNKLVGFRTIVALYGEDKIDTVYVRYADEDVDRAFYCMKPSDMKNLKYIITNRDPSVIGWRLHHHHFERKNLAAARSMMKNDET